MKLAKKWLKWTLGIVGSLVLLLLIWNAIFVWTSDKYLEHQLAKVKAAGDPLTLADLARKPIPPDKNAAIYLRQAAPAATALETAISNWVDAEKDKHLDYLSYYGDGWIVFRKKQPMPDEMYKAMKAIFAAHADLFPLLQKAADCSDYDAQFDYSTSSEQMTAQLLPIIQNARSIARVLAYRTRLLVIDGKYDEAARMALISLKLARHIERNPFLISYLVAMSLQGMAVEQANLVLQSGPVAQELRQAIDAELATLEQANGYTAAIKTDRAGGIDYFSQLPLRDFWLYNRGRWNRVESEYLDTIADCLKAAPDAYPRRRENVTIDKTTGQPSGSYAELYYPAVDATHQAMTRIRAQVRCLRILNALQTRAKSTDKPQKLPDLGLPAQTTLDPYGVDPYTATRLPLHVKHLPEGWLVYSVGPNERDDDGKIDDTRDGDIGVGPPTPTSDKK